MTNCIGIDVGGANLKFSNGNDRQVSVPFELWRNRHGLSDALRHVVQEFDNPQVVAVTMTGELCDCFDSKQDGVRSIVDAVEKACPNSDVRYYQTTGKFVDNLIAVQSWKLTAASNWHAMANYAARFLLNQSGFLIDVGSTTTDVVPIFQGRVVATGKCDLSRMLAGELIYSGVGRSPVAACLPAVQFRNRRFPVAQEFFSSTLDVYLLLDHAIEEPNNCLTADGQPATKRFAAARLARMLCADVEELSTSEILDFALQVAVAQHKLLLKGLETVLFTHKSIPRRFVVCGQGEWLAKELVKQTGSSSQTIAVNTLLSKSASQVGPAHAVAVLATEEFYNE